MQIKENDMIEVGIIGATGYAGSQLTAILAKHPQVHLSHLASHSYAGEKMSDIYRDWPVAVILFLRKKIWKALPNDVL